MAIATGPSPDHPPDEADEEFLRRAGQIWSRQTPSEADSRWRRVDPDVELYEEDEDTGGGTGVVRVARSAAAGLERRDQGYLRATARAERPAEGLGRVLAAIRSAPFGG